MIYLNQIKDIVDILEPNQKLIMPNTNSQYGSSKDIITEDSPQNPLSLYAKISNIAWDYKAKSGTIAGTIGNEELKTLKEFSIDTREKTSFELPEPK